MTKMDQAQLYFRDGYNCCQSVLLSFTEEMGLSKAQAARLGSSFGGGIARLRAICGAVSAMAMVIGLHEGYESPTDADAKAAQYELVRELVAQFQAENGSYTCGDLLDAHPAPGLPQGAHNPACGKFVGDAAAILEAHFQKQHQS